LGTAQLAAIGPATAEALERFHLKADLIPEEFRAEALAESMKTHVSGKRVLWARASRGRDVLPSQLEAAGATVDQLVVYHNLDLEGTQSNYSEQIESGQLDWIGLSSPSIARSLASHLSKSALDKLGHQTHLASISPVTTAAARDVGLPISAEATTYTWPGIFEAIVENNRSKIDK